MNSTQDSRFTSVGDFVTLLPVPLQTCLYIFLAVLLLWQLPPILRVTSTVLEWALRRLTRVGAYPEYLFTEACRRRGRGVPGGVFIYDDALTALVTSSASLKEALHRCLPRRFRSVILVRSALGVCSLSLIVWYVPDLPQGDWRTTQVNLRLLVVAVSDWGRTGQWHMPDGAASLTCGDQTPRP
jgi:hypothetical protein